MRFVVIEINIRNRASGAALISMRSDEVI